MSTQRTSASSLVEENESVYLGTEDEERADPVADPRRLRPENERQRQEVYELRRKFDLNEAMLRELQEANESLEQIVARQDAVKRAALLEAEEKHRAVRKEYESQIESLEATLAQKMLENEELRSRVERGFAAPQAEVEMGNGLGALEENVVSLEEQVRRVCTLLREEEERRMRAEETIEETKSRCEELERACWVSKLRLTETTAALENAREELATARVESLPSNPDPASDSSKGNSLFAEVEDRRRCALDKMNALRDKYYEAKRAFNAKLAETKLLRAERAAMLRKWENDTIDSLAENEELTNEYKKRICELENKLKEERRRKIEAIESAPADASFGYFQSLLNAKRKEAEELRIKHEHLSTRILLQEEAKLRLTRQLRHWRYKATSLEAQLLASKTDDTGTYAVDAEKDIGRPSDPECLRDVPKNRGGTMVDRYFEDEEGEAAEREKSACDITSVVVVVDREVVTCSAPQTESSKKSLRFTDDAMQPPQIKNEPKKEMAGAKGWQYPVVYVPTTSTDNAN